MSTKNKRLRRIARREDVLGMNNIQSARWLRRSAASHDGYLNEAEQAILHAGETLTDAIWENYLRGESTPTDFHRRNSMPSVWMQEGEKLLQEIGQQTKQHNGH
jgi:hypothetical protein